MEKQILDLLNRHESLPIGAIIKRSNAHPVPVEECCKQLFQQGYLTTDSCGVYRLTPSGYRRYQQLDPPCNSSD